MNDEGYTLVEMLVALAIISLAFGGLVESGRLVGRLQSNALHSAHELASDATASRALRDVLQDAGPFLSDGVGGFVGDASRFSFDCGAAARCGARIELGRRGVRLVTFEDNRVLAQAAVPDAAAFRYIDDVGDATAWPLPDRKVSPLRDIALFGDRNGRDALASIKLPADEPLGCVFDVVSQICRRLP
jgi:prepilin-type N-terminal cleavage/methylation domain-containing protein